MLWALLVIGTASRSGREDKPPYRVMFSFTNHTYREKTIVISKLKQKRFLFSCYDHERVLVGRS